MSEIINTGATHVRSRLQLLGTASALALLVALPASAQSGSESRPTIWIEGGYQFEAVTGSETPFLPPLDAMTRAQGLPSLNDIATELSLSRGAEGHITFQPKGSDWILSLSGRYGRAHSTRNATAEKVIVGAPMKQTIEGSGFVFYNVTQSPVFTAYVDQRAETAETHAIIDFQIGRDVGIGILGHATNVVIGFGARYAQFSTRTKLSDHASPDVEFENITTPGFIFSPKYQINSHNFVSAALAERRHSLSAFGPSLSMNNTTTLFGDEEGGELNLDWGANVAVLFGRQRAQTSHQSSTGVGNGINNIAALPVTSRRGRAVTVPNLGGFAGLSYRFTNAKLSAGYRADFFFGAMDRGLDARQSTTTGFHGPFATLSIGFGG